MYGNISFYIFSLGVTDESINKPTVQRLNSIHWALIPENIALVQIQPNFLHSLQHLTPNWASIWKMNHIHYTNVSACWWSVGRRGGWEDWWRGGFVSRADRLLMRYHQVKSLLRPYWLDVWNDKAQCGSCFTFFFRSIIACSRCTNPGFYAKHGRPLFFFLKKVHSNKWLFKYFPCLSVYSLLFRFPHHMWCLQGSTGCNMDLFIIIIIIINIRKEKISWAKCYFFPHNSFIF